MFEQEANVSLAVVVLFPILFYLPKFFEYRYVDVLHPVTTEINCTEYALATLKASLLCLANFQMTLLYRIRLKGCVIAAPNPGTGY